MKNELIDDLDKNSKRTFAEIVQQERKKLGKSLKEIENMRFVEKEVIENGIEIKKKVPLITASYLNRIENGSRDNIAFTIVFHLIEILNLDVDEVISSFGFESLLSKDYNKASLESFLRINEIYAPVISEENEEELPLSKTEKEILIRIIKDVFEFGTTSEENTMYTLRKIIEELDDYRKSRKKLK